MQESKETQQIAIILKSCGDLATTKRSQGISNLLVIWALLFILIK